MHERNKTFAMARNPTCFPPPPSTLRELNPTPAGHLGLGPEADTEGSSSRATTAPATRGIPLHEHFARHDENAESDQS
jgi:hypothetical protein